MNPTAFALAGYLLWTLLLLGDILGLRTYLTLTGQRPANRFKPDGSDVSPFAERLSGAHANCYESFPFLGGLLLLALATDTQRLTDPLALVVLAGRIGQSTVHLLSVSVKAVFVRFTWYCQVKKLASRNYPLQAGFCLKKGLQSLTQPSNPIALSHIRMKEACRFCLT